MLAFVAPAALAAFASGFAAPHVLALRGGDCIDAAALAQEISARLGDTVLTGEVEGVAAFHVVVTREGEAFVATLSAEDVPGTRVVGPTEDCGLLTKQVAVVSAVFLGTLLPEPPAASRPPRPPRPPRPRGPSPAFPPPAPVGDAAQAPQDEANRGGAVGSAQGDGGATSSIAPEPDPSVADSSPTTTVLVPAIVSPPAPHERPSTSTPEPWSLSASAGGGVHVGRALSAGPRLFAGIAAENPAHGWVAEVGIVVDGALGMKLEVGRAHLLAAQVVPTFCLRRDVVVACGHMEVGVAWVQGVDLPGASAGFAPQLAPGASLRIEVPLDDGVVFNTRVTSSVPLVRVQLRDSASGQLIVAQAPVAVGVGAGVSFALPALF